MLHERSSGKKLNKSTRQHDYSSLTIPEALSKLLEAAEMIELRRSVKPHENTRIRNAFHLADEPGEVPHTKAERRREEYRKLLRDLRTQCGPEVVIPCALGLGQTAVGNMREAYRLRLPGEVAKHRDKFKSPFIKGLVRADYWNG